MLFDRLFFVNQVASGNDDKETDGWDRFTHSHNKT